MREPKQSESRSLTLAVHQPKYEALQRIPPGGARRVLTLVTSPLLHVVADAPMLNRAVWVACRKCSERLAEYVHNDPVNIITTRM